MLLVRAPGASSDLEQRVKNVVLDVVGRSLKVSVQSVPSIELSRRGKLRKIVRRIPSTSASKAN